MNNDPFKKSRYCLIRVIAQKTNRTHKVDRQGSAHKNDKWQQWANLCHTQTLYRAILTFSLKWHSEYLSWLCDNTNYEGMEPHVQQLFYNHTYYNQ